MTKRVRKSPTQGLLGRLAIERGYITRNQLNEALFVQGSAIEPVRFGDLLLDMGFLTTEQLEELVEEQKNWGKRQRARKPANWTATTLELLAARSADPGGWSDDALAALVVDALERNASDLHVQAGAAPFIRRYGQLEQIRDDVLSPERASSMVASILTPQQREQLRSVGDVALTKDFRGQLRLRIGCFVNSRGLGAVFRLLPTEIPSIQDLTLPRVVARLASFSQGLAVIAGSAGTGKSSTVASLIRLINEERKQQIVILEKQAEFFHESISSNVIHRQVPTHARSFAVALRAAFREDPDVIVVSEMRDQETISQALSAAETGHLVIGATDTTDAVNTIAHLVGVFPSSQQQQVQTSLSESLRGIVSQQLVVRADGTGRVPAVEVLFNTPSVAPLIRSGLLAQIPNAIQMGRDVGMRQFADSIDRLVRVGLISQKEATIALA